MAMRPEHIIIKDKIYIPIKLLPSYESTRDAYTKRFYEDSACSRCEYKPDRHSNMCDVCEAYKGVVKLWSRWSYKGRDYIGLPIGDKRFFEKKTGVLFSEVKVYDKRVEAPFVYPVKFLGQPYPNQVEAIDQFMDKKYGLLEAPPRTGKTLMAVAICVQLGQRVLMMASQHEFIAQFMDHLHGNAAEGIPKCTNLPELEKKHKKKLYGFPKTDADFDNFQFFCMTYQQFISEKRGKDRLARLFPHIGTVCLDEVHKAAADKFAEVVSVIPSRYKFGVTATVDRKDKKDVVIRNILGPIVARSSRESMIPRVYVHETGFSPKRKYAGGPASWVYAMQALAKDKKRNELIVRYVMKDLKAGHNIVIPVTFKNHAALLQQMINEAFGKRICETFVGGGGKGNKDARKDTLTAAKLNKTRVIVGIRSLLQMGLNVPSWSCIYTVIPISNKPNYKQETSRIRTPVEGKRQPIVRLFTEEGLGQSWGCSKNCITHLREFKYEFSKLPAQRSQVEYMSGQPRRYDKGRDEDAEFKPSRLISTRKPTAPPLFKRL